MAATSRYNQEQIKAAMEKRNRKLAGGILVKVRCIAAAKSTPKEPKYNLGHELSLALVKDDGEISNVKIRNWVTFPLINTEVEDHVPPDTINMVVPMVQAFANDEEEAPYYPRRDPKTKKMMYKGEEIDPNEADDYVAQAADTCMALIDKVEQDPSWWEGREAIAKVYYQKDKETQQLSDFPSLGSWQIPDLRPGQSLTPEAQWYESGKASGGEEKKANGKPNGKPAASGVKKPSFGKKK